MVSDIDDDAELIANHNEAWSLAYMKRGTSNLARAYIELRELTRKFTSVDGTNPDRERLLSIIHANDL